MDEAGPTKTVAKHKMSQVQDQYRYNSTDQPLVIKKKIFIKNRQESSQGQPSTRHSSENPSPLISSKVVPQPKSILSQMLSDEGSDSEWDFQLMAPDRFQ